MTCKNCGERLGVVDVKTYDNVCVRKYKCKHCGAKFFTEERESTKYRFSLVSKYKQWDKETDI